MASIGIRKMPVRLSLAVPGGLRENNRFVVFRYCEVAVEIPEDKDCVLCYEINGFKWGFKRQRATWECGSEMFEVVLVPENPAEALDILNDLRSVGGSSKWHETQSVSQLS
ncbi:MAG: hypothetical protein V4467_03880 [Patescibacteria group bacterium]